MATVVLTITQVTRVVLHEEYDTDELMQYYTDPLQSVTKEVTDESVAEVNDRLDRSDNEMDRAVDLIFEFDKVKARQARMQVK